MKAEWQLKKLGDLCDVIAGQSPEGSFYNSDGNGMPFYQGKKDFGEKHLKSPTVWTTQITKIAEQGDILMSVRAPVGPVNYATEKICIGRGLAAIRCKPVLNKDFLFYQLLFLQPEISGKVGAVFASINKSEIEALPIYYTPLPEQQRIVRILDEAFAAIAVARANAESNLRAARELFESYLNEVFTQKGNKWPVNTLGNLCEVLDHKRVPVTKRDRTKGIYPYYGASGILDYVNNYIFDEKLVLIGEDGAKWGAGEKSAFAVEGKCWVNNHAHVIRPNRNLVLDNWLIFNLNFMDLTKFISGLTVQKLNQGNLLLIPILTPSIRTQEQFCSEIVSIQEEIEHLDTILKQKVIAFDELSLSLLHHAFTGQL